MSPNNDPKQPEQVRVSARVVMDQQALAKAQDKAKQHGVPFPEYLERAVKLYGKLLDKKITVISRPL